MYLTVTSLANIHLYTTPVDLWSPIHVLSYAPWIWIIGNARTHAVKIDHPGLVLTKLNFLRLLWCCCRIFKRDDCDKEKIMMMYVSIQSNNSVCM